MMMLRLLLLLVAGYVGLCLAAFLAQRRMLYFPQPQEPSAALREARSRNLEPWMDENGHILGWRARHPSGQPVGTLLVFHGNAGSALDRTYVREAFQSPTLPFALDIVLLEYPGYGPRAGTPAESTILLAGVEAIDRLSQESRPPIYLLGESLGSAAAVLAAARRPATVKGLLLVTPLKSIPAIARRHYPILPSFLVRDTFHADQALEGLHMPIGFLVAGQDDVVFPDLGIQLYARYQGPKRLWLDEQALHNTLDLSPALTRWREMLAFVMSQE
jgi:pimeloyl-ACP methyl ester carboxylesterase